MGKEEDFIITENLKTADTLDDAKRMLLIGAEKTMVDCVSDPKLRESAAFEKMYTKIDVVIETMKAGAGTVSSVVSELPTTVKEATVRFCEAIKDGADDIWKDIKAGSPSLSSTIKKAWGAILDTLSKLFKAMAPLVEKGSEILEEGHKSLDERSHHFCNDAKGTSCAHKDKEDKKK